MNAEKRELGWSEAWTFFWSRKELIGFLLGLVIGLGSAYLWFEAKITTSAKQAVLGEDFLKTLAQHVRPTCVFDSRGTIEVDLGTADYIDRIAVTLQPAAYGMDITLDCKKHLAYAPLITCLNSGISTVEVIRIPPNGWKYSMRPASTFTSIADAAGMNTNDVWRFKLEIMH
jgi:hypothetical protein